MTRSHPRDGADLPWRADLSQQVDTLGRWIEGRFVSTHGRDNLDAAEKFLDLDYLRSAVMAMHPRSVDGDTMAESEDLDLRIAASRFVRQYAAPVTSVALVGLATGIGLDVSIGRCAIIRKPGSTFQMTLELDDRQVVACRERPTESAVAGPTVESVGELREYVWTALYAGHLQPVIEGVLRIVNVSPKLLWSNAAEWVGMVMDSAIEYLPVGSLRQRYASDCEALLAVPTLPDVQDENPLRDKLDWIPAPGSDFPRSVQTRRMCCLTYYLEDRYGRLCANCPYLPLEDRIALIRERHGVPMVDASGHRSAGPAEDRSIETGLAKLAHAPMSSSSGDTAATAAEGNSGT